MQTTRIAIGIVVLALATTATWGQAATAEARGVLADPDGKAIVGAKITFKPRSNPDQKYEGKTSKKGRYYVPGMFNPASDGMWTVEIEAEGFLPIQMVVETRNAQRVLLGDVRTVKIKPNAKIPEVMIRPFGFGQIDFVMAPEAEVIEAAAAASQAAAAAAAAESGAAAAKPKADPYETALTRISEGNLAGSIEYFDKAIADEPDDAERVASYAKVLYQLGRFDEAETQARRALELSPGDVELMMVLYSTYVGEGDLEAAEGVLVEAKQAAPGDPRILRQLAFVATQSGDAESAIAATVELTELDPADAEAWLALAGLYADSGRMDESAAAYQKVVDLNPDEAPRVFFNLGALMMNRPDRTEEDTTRAIAAFRKATELKPDYLEARKQLAFALLGTGDRAGARAELEAYVALAPDAADSAQMNALIQSLQ